ncbi:glycolate oxidase subunit GlcE [Caulobacter sp. KR2-114]|uniref:glycolate oxidase subunit GlcE n=1 Tax=Caulobacter sp. KR2-114 TaxID=3400912 RepID=UPI003C0B64D9
MADADLSNDLGERVRAAADAGQALRLVGGDTKAFYGRAVAGEPLPLAGHAGIVAYQPSELVITARAGTPLAEIEAVLAEGGQMLAFEPPSTGPASTLGGVVAAGLSGPRRPFAGAVRDSVLGVTILDGLGRRLRFGGTVFKNVAGFDAFRLMAGAQGALGVLLDISLRVAPRPRAEAALAFEMGWSEAQGRIAGLMRRPLPLSAAAHHQGRLHLRLSGPEAAVAAARAELGGQDDAPGFWDAVRHMALPVFTPPKGLWRLSVPPLSTVDLPGEMFIDWGGAQRWLAAGEDPTRVRVAAATAGGHATLFFGEGPAETPFAPLAPALHALHKRLKAALDPRGILNPGRLYPDL